VALVDYFLKIEGISGESVDSKHKGEIELESFSWGETQLAPASGAGSGAGAGKVQMQDLHFVSRINKASPRLMLACASAKHLKEAILTARKAGKAAQEFLIIKMRDILVSSYQTGGSHESDALPLEEVAFNFGQIELEYRPQKADGSLDAAIKAGWDKIVNKAI
jgi:type VI secretion system secreted protein Hcp